MTTGISFFVLSLAGIASAQVWAGPPVKTPLCADKIDVRPAKGGAGVFFDEDCGTAYVLPPATGTIELSGIAPTASAEDCRELAALERSRAELAERLERLAKGKTSTKPDEAGSTIGGGGGLSEPVDQTGEPEELEEAEGDYDQFLADLSKLRIATKYFTETEGLVAKVTYTLDHDGLVAEYARLNPHLKNVTRLQPETAYLSFAAKGEKLREEQSEVLDYTVPGIVRFPGEGELSSGELPENSVYFGTALSGKIRLTVKAACRIMNAQGKTPDVLKASQLEKHLSGNITYAYALNVRRKYHAYYNFKALFEHIEKRTKKGGFLSSKSVHEVIQRNESGSWFTFTGESDDTRFPNEVLVQQLKAEMIDRVLSQISEAKVPGSSQIPALLEPGKKGVDVAAEGLKKCPYAYCQVAGYVLDFVGATFGRSTAVSRFLSTVGSESSETVNESKALRFIGTSTFKDRL